MNVTVNGKKYDVEVLHYRQLNGQLVHQGSTAKHMRKNFSCRGGLTVTHLFRNGKIVTIGQAACSNEDNFNRKYGRELAISRAVKTLESSV